MAEKEPEYIPQSAMVIVAHPDDAEFLCAGTVAKWAQAGSTITYVVITNGNKGSEDPEMTPAKLAEVREAEQRAAGAILGVKHFEFMGYEDGYLVHTLGLRRDLTRIIRKHRPEVVFCFDPTQRFLGDTYANHPDHRASGDAAIDAIFPSARDRLTFPELLTENLAPHKVSSIWMGGSDQPNAWVDITPTLELKKKALMAHPSQLGEDVIGFVLEMGKGTAEGQPFEFAESFRTIQLEPVPEWKD
jgi:LmbE family N-acetylglucosaminyl deacetylase